MKLFSDLKILPATVLFAMGLICVVGCSSDKKSMPKDSSKTEKSDPETVTANPANSEKLADPIKPPAPPVNNPAFHDQLNEAAEGYLRYAMVNEVATFAPEDCRAPSAPPSPRISQADDETPHGKKLYYLFAKDITHYLNDDESDSPVGQTLVKESWTAKDANANARNLRNHSSGHRINPRATDGDKVYEIGKRKDLFVMFKLDPKTPDTDEGWVYGVIDSETRKPTVSGKVVSCMECHLSAKHDRLFGAKHE